MIEVAGYVLCSNRISLKSISAGRPLPGRCMVFHLLVVLSHQSERVHCHIRYYASLKIIDFVQVGFRAGF